MVKYTTRINTTITPMAASKSPLGLRLTLAPPLARTCFPERTLFGFIYKHPFFYKVNRWIMQ